MEAHWKRKNYNLGMMRIHSNYFGKNDTMKCMRLLICIYFVSLGSYSVAQSSQMLSDFRTNTTQRQHTSNVNQIICGKNERYQRYDKNGTFFEISSIKKTRLKHLAWLKKLEFFSSFFRHSFKLCQTQRFLKELKM